MAVTKVSDIIQRTKWTLHETTQQGTRWKNEELLVWLNEAYQAVVQIKPDATAANESIDLVAGSKQTIPERGTRLIDCIRNTHPESAGEAVMIVSRKQLDSTRRGWHREPETKDIEHYIFDEMDPKNFYVYPPAENGAQLEVVYSTVPDPHPVTALTDDTVISLNDSYAPVIVDYIMYRAYSKDADHSENLNRAMMHYQAFMESLGRKVQTDMGTNPNHALPQSAPR